MDAATLPEIIQGGMGIAVSDWRLARAVSQHGQLGVVSGTAIDSVMVRRLQDGDIGGHVRRAFEKFPIPQAAADAIRRYFRPEGRPGGQPYKPVPMHHHMVDQAREQLTMLASFVEVHLAKEGHSGLIGMNLLTKVQLPNLASIYGAMLAGVDYLLMGAGIPREIPAALDALAEHKPASLTFDLVGPRSETPEKLTLDAPSHWTGEPPPVKRPRFLPIVASNSLATMLARKGNGGIDGFVIEGPTAGGHNAPPRGEATFNERGEPIYGPRDVVDLQKISELGLPFWLAGGAGSPEKLEQAREAGAAGIQVGTLFAFCEESGLDPALKTSVLEHAARGEVDVKTDALASPTGYPFKVVHLNGNMASRHRERVCDLGYLRSAHRAEGGKVVFRCASEPVEAFVEKGGDISETEGRQCLCNALMANIGMGQFRPEGVAEPPLLTSGDDLMSLPAILAGKLAYTAGDVIDFLLRRKRAPKEA